MSDMIRTVLTSKVFPALEFSLIISLVIVTYWGMYMSGFNKIKPAMKFTLSLVLGSFAYMIGKMIVISLIGGDITPDTAYAF